MLTLDSFDLSKTTPEQIGELLIEAKKAYYTGSKPIMDDHTYDTLEEILRKKSPFHRIFTKVGHPNFDTGFDKKKHQLHMGSQNKVSSYEDLVHYFELKKISNLEFVVQPKCDGISLEIEYKNGQLVDAITRGDGEIGDVITQNVVKMKNFVVNLPNHFNGSIRCEVMVTKKDFEIINNISDEKYSNPRNAASGLSQRLDSKYSEYCSLYAVDISSNTKTELEKVEILKKYGFATVESSLCKSFDEIEKIYQLFLNQKRNNYPFEIDGLVVKINDSEVIDKLGYKNNRPKFQVAYKFPASTDQSIIKSVAWQVGPMGTITPVANIEPVEIAGAVITFASLANYDLIKEKNLNIGDIVKISRRGDVIPHIESVVSKVTPGHLLAPSLCPSCNTKLVAEDKFLRCPNSANCQSQILGSLRLFCDTLGILGLSDKTIAKLYAAKRIKLPGDFFKLTVNDIQDLENLGEKSAKNIIHQIQSKKVLSLVEVFDSAIIPNFSKKRIQQLITLGFDTPDKLLKITVEDIEPLFGFQITLAKKIVAGLSLRQSWIKSILDNISLKSDQLKSGKLKGLSFCVTGTLSRPRSEIENEIISLGGKVSSAVSKNTSYLVCNDTNSKSSKFITAQKLGIKIINEKELSILMR